MQWICGLDYDFSFNLLDLISYSVDLATKQNKKEFYFLT